MSESPFSHPDLELTWVHDARIAVLRQHNDGQMTREVVDDWVTGMLKLLNDWPATQPLLFLDDLRAAKPTAYAQWRTIQMLQLSPRHLFGRYAPILNEDGFSFMYRIMAPRLIRQYWPQVMVRIFTDEAAALEWLADGRHDTPST